MVKIKKESFWLILIIFLAIFPRFFRLGEPPVYMFDEVYHAFTAVELERGNRAAWEWWNTPPQGFAYEWTHPPLAKEAMVLGIKILGPILPKQAPRVDGKIDPHPLAWRFPVAAFGAGTVVLVYLLGRQLFNSQVGLFAALLFNFDGLFFVQSRIGMNDTFFLFFMLLAFYLFIKNKWWGMGIALGLALASKWTTIYAMGILGGLFFVNFVRGFLRGGLAKARPPLIKSLAVFLLSFLIIPLAVYLLTYLSFFTSGHTWQQFNELQYQMWWYHTRLQATHPYQSGALTWPILYRPIWYYVDYQPEISQTNLTKQIDKGEPWIANIYAMGNPVIWWGGMVTIGWLIISLIKQAVEIARQPRHNFADVGGGRVPRNSRSLIIVLLGYFGFFLPWVLSPRIMFLYHYLPSVPFMCLALGYGLDKIRERKVISQIGTIKITGQRLAISYLLLAVLVFVYFYPHLSGLPVPKWLSETYFWFKSWR